jgi:hypothetical protein
MMCMSDCLYIDCLLIVYYNYLVEQLIHEYVLVVCPLIRIIIIIIIIIIEAFLVRTLLR